MTSNTTSSNRISKLWNDKDSRSVILQIVSFAIILGFFAFVVNNAVINMAEQGKDINFTFLFDTASYDINQTLIAYDSRSTHFMVGLVGLLNTLLIAVFGIILATILGFILGVMRLSNNWLTQKLSYVYIEYMRNVPVLLHILLIYGVIVHSCPRPNRPLILTTPFSSQTEA